ncbi:hypothetical protein [Alkalihalophilus marmarensis]|uniref:hypothetical protein n=1 Tax=Alkalihalophilus marmarensis TaxID=521377 RepID=UPI002DBC42D7|nr:hypothetical protein [Alkalihalophilus marmarensis]MEC2073429.1 hypothetical protein [Alkalihalophilus marmarensis]
MVVFQIITVRLGVSGAFGGCSGCGWRVNFQYLAVFVRNKWKVVRINEGFVQIIRMFV